MQTLCILAGYAIARKANADIWQSSHLLKYLAEFGKFVHARGQPMFNPWRTLHNVEHFFGQSERIHIAGIEPPEKAIILQRGYHIVRPFQALPI
jgi:hypothetical protein